MKCSETKPKLGFYLDQTLPDGEIQELRNHLGACTSCSIEFQNLEKIESVIQAGIYSEPPDGYWSDVPQTITKRIGIGADASPVEQFIESIQGIFAAKNFRWGFAGAFAVVLLVFFFSKIFVPAQKPITITQDEPLKSESGSMASLVELSEVPNTASLSSQKDAPINEKENLVTQEPGSQPMTNLQEPTEGSRKIAINYLSADLLALKSVESRPLNMESRKIPGVNRELYPIPNSEFILPIPARDLQDENKPVQRTFALDKQNAQFSKADAVSDVPEEIKRIRSGFLETLWIVQESKAMDEKKNIWLSYINRESDITYQSLAIYNLALVLAKISEESTDLDQAAEARSFFLEHKEALRFQMGIERFDNKLSLFDEKLTN